MILQKQRIISLKGRNRHARIVEGYNNIRKSRYGLGIRSLTGRLKVLNGDGEAVLPDEEILQSFGYLPSVDCLKVLIATQTPIEMTRCQFLNNEIVKMLSPLRDAYQPYYVPYKDDQNEFRYKNLSSDCTQLIELDIDAIREYSALVESVVMGNDGITEQQRNDLETEFKNYASLFDSTLKSVESKMKDVFNKINSINPTDMEQIPIDEMYRMTNSLVSNLYNCATVCSKMFAYDKATFDKLLNELENLNKVKIELTEEFAIIMSKYMFAYINLSEESYTKTFLRTKDIAGAIGEHNKQFDDPPLFSIFSKVLSIANAVVGAVGTVLTFTPLAPIGVAVTGASALVATGLGIAEQMYGTVEGIKKHALEYKSSMSLGNLKAIPDGLSGNDSSLGASYDQVEYLYKGFKIFAGE